MNALLLAPAFAILAAACAKPGSRLTDFWGQQLQGGSLPNKTLSLTFDDGPADRTNELAEYLADEGVPATFFAVGQNIPGNEYTLANVRNLGHLIANHSYTHAEMSRTYDPVGEVRDTDNLIAPYVDKHHFLFRAPYGDWDWATADILNDTSLQKYVGPIFWDIGGELSNGYAADWACWAHGLSISDCGNRYIAEAKDLGRGIILMHDAHSDTVDMVKYIVPRLKAAGFRFVRLDAVPAIAAELRN